MGTIVQLTDEQIIGPLCVLRMRGPGKLHVGWRRVTVLSLELGSWLHFHFFLDNSGKAQHSLNNRSVIPGTGRERAPF